MVGRGLTLALLVPLVACYQWVPASVETVSPGMEVRLRLSETGAADVAELAGTPQREVSGELLQWADEVMISAPLFTTTGRDNRLRDNGLRQRFIVGADDVLGVDMRELNRQRTWMLAGGVSLVVGSALVWGFGKLFGNTNPPGSQPPKDVESDPFGWGVGWALLRSFR